MRPRFGLLGKSVVGYGCRLHMPEHHIAQTRRVWLVRDHVSGSRQVQVCMQPCGTRTTLNDKPCLRVVSKRRAGTYEYFSGNLSSSILVHLPYSQRDYLAAQLRFAL